MASTNESLSSAKRRPVALWILGSVVCVVVAFVYWPLVLFPMQARSPAVATSQIILLERETENPILVIEATQATGIVLRTRHSDGSWKVHSLNDLVISR
jgi:hypothetical protein